MPLFPILRSSLPRLLTDALLSVVVQISHLFRSLQLITSILPHRLLSTLLRITLGIQHRTTTTNKINKFVFLLVVDLLNPFSGFLQHDLTFHFPFSLVV